jgi:hypothetical protein
LKLAFNANSKIVEMFAKQKMQDTGLKINCYKVCLYRDESTSKYCHFKTFFVFNVLLAKYGGLLPNITHKYYARLKMLARYKHSRVSATEERKAYNYFSGRAVEVYQSPIA